MILWLNPHTGVSGDMLLGALLDLGAPVERVREAVASTGLTGWRLDYRRERRGALLTGRAVIEIDDDSGDGHTACSHSQDRPAAELLRLVGRAEPRQVAELAERAVAAIAEVEGALHGEDPARVHLHEIGGHDTVIDTVGVAAALHLLDVTEVYCAPLAIGTGTVRTRHGELPTPAPATTELLARVGAEVVGTDIDYETVTPTGAALLLAAGTRFGSMPRLTLTRVGYGAGGRQLPRRPNALQALLGERAERGTDERLLVLETNVDDVTGEHLGHLITRALAEGARDAWITPVVMKKSRPAHTVHLLVDPARVEHFERLLFAESGTLGVRRVELSRTAARRRVIEVTVEGHPIRVTRGPYRAKPEYDDAARAAAALGLPLREVVERALAAAERK